MTKNEQLLTFYGGRGCFFKKANTPCGLARSIRFAYGMDGLFVPKVDLLSVFSGGHSFGYSERAVKTAECRKAALDRDGQNAVLCIHQKITRPIHFQRLNIGIKGNTDDLSKIP